MAVTAGIQAAFLIGYAITIAILTGTRGADGPEAVASTTGVIVEIITFSLLGAGVVLVAIGRWRATSWSSVPFFVTQALALAVGLPVLFGSSAPEPRAAAVLVCLSAIIGLLAQVAGRTSAEPAAPPGSGPTSSG